MTNPSPIGDAAQAQCQAAFDAAAMVNNVQSESYAPPPTYVEPSGLAL
jgi:hypothetical protein